jgi:hypothetical protein
MLSTARLKILRLTLDVARVVVVGGGIAGVYFTSRLLELVKDVEVVLVEPEDHHFFVVGVPMAFGGWWIFKSSSSRCPPSVGLGI